MGEPVRFHGDLHFENIFSTNNSTNPFYLLDWRQNFSGDTEVGDLYYDLAKLNHGLIISHEIINNNHFEVNVSSDNISFEFHRKNMLIECQIVLKDWVEKNNYDWKKVCNLTSLIFLNISPLHEHPYSLVLYYLGLSTLWNDLKSLKFKFYIFHIQLQKINLAGWQSGYAAACKAVYAGSIPASASIITYIMKIAIIGNGFVGSTIDNGFCLDSENFVIDPLLNNEIKDLNGIELDAIFVCVPTPMSQDGSVDGSIILEVFSQIKEFCNDCIVVIKSTITPDIINKLISIDEKFIYNPEFLREKHALDDFKNCPTHIFGGKKEYSMQIAKIYKDYSLCKTEDCIYVDIKSASLIKYTINSFLALKVIFFNQIHNLFQK